MEDVLKGILRPVIIFVVGLGLGVAGSLLNFDLKGEVCKSAAPVIKAL